MTGPRSEPPMPMLTTLRIRLPVRPRPGPAAHAIRKVRHPVEHGMNPRYDVLAVDQDCRAARGSQRHVEHGALLRDIDAFAAEHGVDPGAQAAVLRQADQQSQRFVGDRGSSNSRGRGPLPRPSAARRVRDRARTARAGARRGCSDGVLREPSTPVDRWRTGRRQTARFQSSSSAPRLLLCRREDPHLGPTDIHSQAPACGSGSSTRTRATAF